MSKYQELIDADAPRLVIRFRVDERGQEDFEVKTVGPLAILYMINAIGEFQHAMRGDGAWQVDDCPERAAAIVWDAAARRYAYFMHEDAPQQALCGMLEVVKAMFVGSSLAQRAAAQATILGPDGRPMRG